MRKLFVSYARENKPDVDQLVEHLRTMGYDTWVDAALRGGQDWWDEILDRIADTDVVIAIYSSAALNSTACRREFEWATALGKPVVPVAVEPPPTALPSRFARRQIIDYSQPAQRDRAALQLQGALATLPPAPALPDPLPEPPAAPLSYLTDLIDLITQANVLDHDQQHQVLRQLEPALTSFDPLERQGGRDILERFGRRPDLYADVDRAITRLRQLSDQPVRVDSEPATQTRVEDAERSEGPADNTPPPPTAAADAAQQQPADSTLVATPISEQPRKPATTRQVIPRDKLGVLSKIGQGGQGIVYRAPNVKTKFAASMVYKEYKPQTRTDIDFTALAAMPALVEESLSYTQAERLISFAAWPCAIIDDAGTPTGFVMPAIPDEFFIDLTTAKGVSPSTAEFQHLLNHPTVLAARGIDHR